MDLSRSSSSSASASFWPTSGWSSSSSVSCGCGRQALLTGRDGGRRSTRFCSALGAVLSLLIIYKLAVLRLASRREVFGETMMLVYYGYAVPLSLKIGRGFYEDGIWADGGFVPYSTHRRPDVAGRGAADARADRPRCATSAAS